MILRFYDIVVFCCVSNIGLVKYAFISMDSVSLKPNVMATCAIIDRFSTRPSLPHTFPKAAVSNFSHIKGVSRCTTKEVVVEREEEEMKRPGHSWPSQARLIYPCSYSGPWLLILWTLFDAVHTWPCFLRLTFLCAVESICLKN